MTGNASGTRHHRTGREARSAWATGWTAAAAVLMIFGGITAVLEGIAAVAGDGVFAAIPDLTYAFSLTCWGRLHLLLGIVVTAAGLALFTGATWARAAAVALAGLSMVAHFVWLPYAPAWSIVLIVIDGLVIRALCAPRREVSS